MEKIGKLFIISAPSGAGKTTLTHELIKRYGSDYSLKRTITYTSRPPRALDVQGLDYNFITPEEFEKYIEQGFFLEWSNAYGNYYGTPCSVLDELNEGISCLLILDRLGAHKIKQKHPQAVLVWLWVNDIEILEKRLIKRNSEKKEEIVKRLLWAVQEIEQEEKNPLYQYKVLNVCIDNALSELHLIVKTELKK